MPVWLGWTALGLVGAGLVFVLGFFVGLAVEGNIEEDERKAAELFQGRE